VKPWALDSLFLVLTSACNLRCAYCCRSRASPATMAWPTVEAGIARLWASPLRGLRVIITGGEPLLEFGLVQRLIGHLRATKPPGRHVSINLLTNGMLLDEERIEFLARHRVTVQISIDGAEPAQRLRGTRTIPVLDALEARLREHHRAWFRQSVRAAMTLVPRTIPFLADSVEHLIRRGFTTIGISAAKGDVPGWDKDLVPVLDDQFAQMYGSSLARYRRSGDVPVSNFRRHSSAGQPIAAAWCGVASGHMAALDVDGQVYGCPFALGSGLDGPSGLLRAASDAMRIGVISHAGLAARLPAYRRALGETGLFDRRYGYYSSFGRCRECPQVRYCDACPLSIALAPRASDPKRIPDFICAFSRVSAKYRRRFPVQRN